MVRGFRRCSRRTRRAPPVAGMHIVEELADEWGVMPAEDRNAKTVWFSVAIPGAR